MTELKAAKILYDAKRKHTHMFAVLLKTFQFKLVFN